MTEENITRVKLEKMSFAELSHLADAYGIDVPEDLDRRFLIAELLEISEEDVEISEDMIISSANVSEIEKKGEISFVLPKNYNETQITCVLRNPVWLFVFWNMGESDVQLLKSLGEYSLNLRICSYDNPEDTIPAEAFEIKTVETSQEQYVLLPPNKKYVKIELVYSTETTGKVLAFSNLVSIPQGSKLVNDLQSGIDADFSPLVKLSDINTIISKQYSNHRHSFS